MYPLALYCRSTYDDNMIQQNASLSAVVRGRGPDASSQAPNADHPYSNLTEWLAQTDLVSGVGHVTCSPEMSKSAMHQMIRMSLFYELSKNLSLCALCRRGHIPSYTYTFPPRCGQTAT